jgi:hypothetical protein
MNNHAEIILKKSEINTVLFAKSVQIQVITGNVIKSVTSANLVVSALHYAVAP